MKTVGNLCLWHWYSCRNYEYLSTELLFDSQPCSPSFSLLRLSRLLLRLPALRLMNATITEELFFKGLIGNVRIDSVIPHILKMEPADYNSQIIGHSIWKLRSQFKVIVLSQNTRRYQIELTDSRASGNFYFKRETKNQESK